MKKLTILLFSILISFSSYGEWTDVYKDKAGSGGTYHLDLDSFKKHNENVYWWQMWSYPKLVNNIIFSVVRYQQGQCGIHRYKTLATYAHKQPMGEGKGEEVEDLPSKWVYPKPDTIYSLTLTTVCESTK
jgi:hypothetical protein